jgi:hypothetical protein
VPINANSINAADRDRLAKLLGLLGSNHAGERDSAGLAAHRLVQQRGVTWRDVLSQPSAVQRLPAVTWRQVAARCLEHRHLLSNWERDFLGSLISRQQISIKQHLILNKIAKSVIGEFS